MRYTCRRLQTLNKSRSPDSDRGPGTSLGVGLCSQEHVRCNNDKSETTTFWPNKLEAIFIKIWVFLHSTRYAIVKPGLPTEKALIGLMFACFLFMLALKRFGFGSCCFYYHDSDYFLLIWLLGELFWQSRLKKGGTELEPWGSTINSDIQATGLSLLAILIILNPLLICFKALGHNYYVSSCRFPLLS